MIISHLLLKIDNGSSTKSSTELQTLIICSCRDWFNVITRSTIKTKLLIWRGRWTICNMWKKWLIFWKMVIWQTSNWFQALISILDRSLVFCMLGRYSILRCWFCYRSLGWWFSLWCITIPTKSGFLWMKGKSNRTERWLNTW